MKKFIIVMVGLILIFLLSFFIGSRINVSDKLDKMWEDGYKITSKSDAEIGEVETTISENETNNEHFVLRNVKGHVEVFSIDDNEKEEEYLSTDIAVEYLPEKDKTSLKEGIHVYSQEELYEILQDFE